jgi:AraC family transcriptional regulator
MLDDANRTWGRPGADQRGAESDIFRPIPDDAGPRVTTPRGGAIYAIRASGFQKFTSSAHFVGVMVAPSPSIAAAYGSDKVRQYEAPLGMIVVSPANEDGRMSWALPKESVLVAIKPEGLLDLAAHEIGAGSVELRPPAPGTVDMEALGMARLLKDELSQREAPNRLLVDSLVTLLGIHLLRNYSNARTLPASTGAGGLSVQNARRMQEFLRANFAAPLSVAQLAAVCELSPSHFIQGFTQTFGWPPYRYVLNLRLDFAEALLLKGDMTIGDVAHSCGFSSQSHLTSAMRRYRGRTPAQVRRNR